MFVRFVNVSYPQVYERSHRPGSGWHRQIFLAETFLPYVCSENQTKPSESFIKDPLPVTDYQPFTIRSF